VADRDELGDHAAHRCPDHVDLVEAERAGEAGAVIGEVREAVGSK